MPKKRRTKSDKRNARHNFVYSWNPSSSTPKKRPSVKGQFVSGSKSKVTGSKQVKRAKNTASKQDLLQTRKEIIKSVSLAGLIVSLELVIYFIL